MEPQSEETPLDKHLGFMDCGKYKLDNTNSDHDFAKFNIIWNQEIDINSNEEDSETDKSDDDDEDNDNNQENIYTREESINTRRTQRVKCTGTRKTPRG